MSLRCPAGRAQRVARAGVACPDRARSRRQRPMRAFAATSGSRWPASSRCRPWAAGAHAYRDGCAAGAGGLPQHTWLSPHCLPQPASTRRQCTRRTCRPASCCCPIWARGPIARRSTTRPRRRLYRDACGALIAWQLASRDGGAAAATTRRCWRASSRLFPDWYVAKHLGITLTVAQRATLDSAFRQVLDNNLAQPRVYRAPRFSFAQSDGDAAESRRPRFSGGGIRSDHLRPGLAAARCVHRLGRGAGARLGRALLGTRARSAVARRRGFRRLLARLRVDGRATSFEDAGHFRPACAPRRQACLPRRHAARHALPAPRLRPLPGARPAAADCSTSSKQRQPVVGYTF